MWPTTKSTYRQKSPKQGSFESVLNTQWLLHAPPSVKMVTTTTFCRSAPRLPCPQQTRLHAAPTGPALTGSCRRRASPERIRAVRLLETETHCHSPLPETRHCPHTNDFLRGRYSLLKQGPGPSPWDLATPAVSHGFPYWDSNAGVRRRQWVRLTWVSPAPLPAVPSATAQTHHFK